VNGSCRVSVVIPTHGRRTSVDRELRALCGQNLPAADFEVIVSIDGSEDGTREAVDAFPAPFRLTALWRPKRGRAAACNAGAAEARGDLLVLLDDDMEPEPDCLSAHIAAHCDRPRRGVVGAVPIRVGPSSPPVVEYVAAKFNAHLENLARPGSRIGLRGFYSGNFSIRREVFAEVGGYDEDFQLYGNEDGDLAARLTQAGVELVYRSEARARQHYEKDFASLARDNLEKGKTAVLSVRKNPHVLDQVRLGGYARTSRKWRLARRALLAASRGFPGTPDRIVHLIEALERLRPARLHSYYAHALDYFFWLGASSALGRDEELRNHIFGGRPVAAIHHGPNSHPVHR
jgi:GT2 family glycosyltransferase